MIKLLSGILLKNTESLLKRTFECDTMLIWNYDGTFLLYSNLPPFVNGRMKCIIWINDVYGGAYAYPQSGTRQPEK
jgi:hypothetical protein